MEKDIWKAAVAVMGSIASYLFGGWSILLGVLFFLVLADYFTGMVAALINRELSSRIGFIGIFRKLVIFTMVAVAHFADVLVANSSQVIGGITITEITSESNFIMNTSIIFYAINELVSITENAGKAGVRVPKVLRKRIGSLQEQEGSANDRTTPHS